MYLPALSAISTSEIYISGDVIIDDTAVIAPGVILQAAKGSKIIISAGACIGMGAILKAYQGKIEVKENAILGAGVLVLGNSKINSKACIGSCTTIYNTSVDFDSIIPAGSIMGDPTRTITNDYDSSPQLSNKESDFPKIEIKPDIKIEKEVLETETSKTQEAEIETNSDQEWNIPNNNNNNDIQDPWQNSSVNINQNPVVGQVYINKLLFTLFPEKQLKSNK